VKRLESGLRVVFKNEGRNNVRDAFFVSKRKDKIDTVMERIDSDTQESRNEEELGTVYNISQKESPQSSSMEGHVFSDICSWRRFVN
jgi:hypothetical protein